MTKFIITKNADQNGIPIGYIHINEENKDISEMFTNGNIVIDHAILVIGEKRKLLNSFFVMTPVLKNKRFSEEEIKKAINECYSYGHSYDLDISRPIDDDNLICVNELLEKLFGDSCED